MDDDDETTSSTAMERTPTILEQSGFMPVRTIGHGSFSTVKLALARDFNNASVAIKIIHKHKVPKDFLEKFLVREMAIIRTVSHPNLVIFYQTIETNIKCYLVMEYASKGSLLDLIKKEERLVEYYCRLYIKQLLDCLQYLHGLGIVHRDLKCENLLLDSEENIKLIDFGFARNDMLQQEGESSALSSTYCGSLAYASPEILKGAPYDPFPSDIWAAGVILYTMVFGYLPFNDRNYAKLIKQTKSKLIFPSKIEVSPEIKLLLPKILAPLRSRYKIPDILNDDWTLKEEEPPARPTDSLLDSDYDE